MAAVVYSLTMELRKFVAAFHSCTAFHPFLGRRQANLFLSAFFMTRWVFPPCPREILWFFGCFWLWVRPLFLCCFAVFPAGETQIWPEDLRVVAVLPGFCLVFDLP